VEGLITYVFSLTDNHTVMELRRICQEHAKMGERSTAPTLEEIFFSSSPSLVLYHLEVAYALLMPAISPNSEEAFEFQVELLRSICKIKIQLCHWFLVSEKVL
jgi:hypothetical protein